MSEHVILKTSRCTECGWLFERGQMEEVARIQHELTGNKEWLLDESQWVELAQAAGLMHVLYLHPEKWTESTGIPVDEARDHFSTLFDVIGTFIGLPPPEDEIHD